MSPIMVPAQVQGDFRFRKGPAREGMRVKLDPIAGLTKKGVMPRNGFYFQCPPLEEFAIERAFSHTDYDTVRGGQQSRKAGVQLIQVSFDTLVVDWGMYTVLQEPVLAEEFSEQLEDIMDSGTPVLLTLAHKMPAGGYERWSATMVGPELQMPATLRTMRVTEKAGEGDARYYTLSFTEYRDPTIGRKKLGKGRPAEARLPVTGYLSRPDGFFHFRAHGASHETVVKGKLSVEHGTIPYAVSLVDLARYFYGNPALATHIAKANKITHYGKHGSLIRHDKFAGKKKPKITIPRPPLEKAVANFSGAGPGTGLVLGSGPGVDG